MTASAVAVCAGLALSTWAGASVLSALDGTMAGRASAGRPAPGRAARVALGYGAGLGLTAFALFVMGLLQARPTVPGVAASLVAAAVVAAALAVRRSRRAASAGALRWRDALWPFGGASNAGRGSPAASRPRGDAVTALLLVLAVLLLAAIAALAVAYRASFIDARAIWLLKARVVFLDGGLDGTYFHDWPDPSDRRGYPLLLPLCGTWAHLLAGRVDDGAARLVSAGFLVALFVLLRDLLARRCSRRLATLGATLALVALPTVSVTVWGVADLPIAVFLLAALHALDGGPAGPATGRASLFLALATFTKNEGLSLSLVTALAWLVAGGGAGPGLARSGGGMRSLGAAARALAAARLLAPPLAVLAIWLAFLRARGLHLLSIPGIDSPALFAERLPVIARGLAVSALDTRWLLVWPLLPLAALAVLRRARDPLVRVAVLVALLQVGVIAAVLSAEAYDAEELVAGAMERVLFHVFPVALFAVLAALVPAAPPREAPEAPASRDARSAPAA